MITDKQIEDWRARVNAMIPSDEDLLTELELRWREHPRNGMTVETAVIAERKIRQVLAAVTVIRGDGERARQSLIVQVVQTANGSVSYRLDKLQALGLVHVAEDGAWAPGKGAPRKMAAIQQAPNARTISKPEFDPAPDLSGEVRCPKCLQRWHSPDRFRVKFHDHCRPRSDGVVLWYETGSLTGGRSVRRGRS